MTAHDNMLSLGARLGYWEHTQGGVCQGFTLSWIEACILNEEHIFHARAKKIILDNNKLPGEIRLARYKGKHPETLSLEERDTLDIPAFYERLALYLSPAKYSDFFHASSSYSQEDIDKISALAASDNIQSQGGLLSFILSQAFIPLMK